MQPTVARIIAAVKAQLKYRNSILIILLFLAPFTSYSQNQNDNNLLPLELSAGLGYAQSFDYNLFNNAVPYRVKGGLGYQLAFRYFLNYNIGIGIRADGMFEIISDYPDDALGYYIDEDMYLSTINIGLDARYVYGQKRVQPFLGIGIKYLYGDLSFSEAGFINGFKGMTIAGTGGVGYLATNDIMVSLEAMAQYGWANWIELPVSDSINRRINPGMFSVLASVSYFFNY